MSRQSPVKERTRDGGQRNLRTRLLARLPVADRRRPLAGIPTAVLEGGDGPPIVLLHGQGEFGAVWTRVIPELVGTHRVIAPDIPGHGESDLPDGRLDRDRILEWLAELIHETCAEPPVLVGHVLGGAIAARLASTRDERIRHLVLVDSLGLAWFRPAPAFAWAMVRFMTRPNEQSQDRLFRRCMADLDGLRSEMGEELELLEAYALDRAVEGKVTEALQSLMPRVGVPRIPRADLEGLDVPTTLIWGRHDIQVRLSVAKAASRRYGWPLHVIEDAADDPAIEQPAAFVEALSSAIDGA